MELNTDHVNDATYIDCDHSESQPNANNSQMENRIAGSGDCLMQRHAVASRVTHMQSDTVVNTGTAHCEMSIWSHGREPVPEFSDVTIKLTLCESDDTKVIVSNFIGNTELDKQVVTTIGLYDDSISRIIEAKICEQPMIGYCDLTLSSTTTDGGLHEYFLVCDTGNNFENKDTDDRIKIRLKLQVISFTRAVNIIDTSTEEKLDRARRYKELGTKLFKQGNIPLAFSKYKRAIQYLILIQKYIENDLADEVDEYKLLHMQCYLNLAACQLAHQSWEHVTVNCGKALMIDSKNVKALYRRAQAYCKKRKYEWAVKDLEQAVAVEPNNSAVNKYLSNIRELLHRRNSTSAPNYTGAHACGT